MYLGIKVTSYIGILHTLIDNMYLNNKKVSEIKLQINLNLAFKIPSIKFDQQNIIKMFANGATINSKPR